MTGEPIILHCQYRPCGREFQARRPTAKFCSDACRQNAGRAKAKAEQRYTEGLDGLEDQGGHMTRRTAVCDDELLHQLMWVSDERWPDNPTELDLQAGFVLAWSDYMAIVADSEIPALFRRGLRHGKLRRRTKNRAAAKALSLIEELRTYRTRYQGDDAEDHEGEP